jgi:hypothetical protein
VGRKRCAKRHDLGGRRGSCKRCAKRHDLSGRSEFNEVCQKTRPRTNQQETGERETGERRRTGERCGQFTRGVPKDTTPNRQMA